MAGSVPDVRTSIKELGSHGIVSCFSVNFRISFILCCDKYSSVIAVTITRYLVFSERFSTMHSVRSGVNSLMKCLGLSEFNG